MSKKKRISSHLQTKPATVDQADTRVRTDVTYLSAPQETQVIEQTFYRGPIPHPDLFKGYEEALPGLADRVMTMSEKQTDHRKNIESRVIWFGGIESILGLIFAFLIVIAGMCLGTYLLMHDKETSGLVVLFGPLITIAGIFYLQRRKKGTEEN